MGKLGVVFVLAVLLGGCSSTTVINVIGGDASTRPESDAGDDDAASGIAKGDASGSTDAGADGSEDAGPCERGALRCRDYKQEKCIVPADGWTVVSGEECCKDEARFLLPDGSDFVLDTKTGYTWRRWSGGMCPPEWRHALLEEAKTVLIGIGTCTPATDGRYFRDAYMCNPTRNEMLNMNTGEVVGLLDGACSYWCVK